jgi:hypothetical protein
MVALHNLPQLAELHDYQSGVLPLQLPAQGDALLTWSPHTQTVPEHDWLDVCFELDRKAGAIALLRQDGLPFDVMRASSRQRGIPYRLIDSVAGLVLRRTAADPRYKPRSDFSLSLIMAAGQPYGSRGKLNQSEVRKFLAQSGRFAQAAIAEEGPALIDAAIPFRLLEAA